MAQLLLIDDNPGTSTRFDLILRDAGYEVFTAPSGRLAFDLLERERIDLVLSASHLPDMSGLHILRRLRENPPSPPVLIVAGCPSTRDAVIAMRFGAADFLDKSLSREGLLHAVRAALHGLYEDSAAELNAELRGVAEATDQPEAHAASRWARVVIPVLRAHRDPRTIEAWSHLVYASPGALRNWCRTAGIPPRQSLVFARLLRAVTLGQGGLHKPEDLLDVVDRRTLAGLFKFAGLDHHGEFPRDVNSFLQTQVLVRDADSLNAIRRLLDSPAQPEAEPANRERASHAGGRAVNGASGGRGATNGYSPLSTVSCVARRADT